MSQSWAMHVHLALTILDLLLAAVGLPDGQNATRAAAADGPQHSQRGATLPETAENSARNRQSHAATTERRRDNDRGTASHCSH